MSAAIANGLVHLRVIDPADLIADLSVLSGYLSPDEQARAAGYKLEAPRIQFILARGFLRLTLSTYLSCDPRDLVFGKTGNEKPVLVPGRNLHFNLSHTSNAIAIVIASDRPVGVDVEQLQMRRSLLDIAGQQFHVAEQEDLQRAAPEDKLAEFYRIWTCKEAYLKGLGHGFAMPLTSFAIRPFQERFVARPKLDEQDWSIVSRIEHNRALAIAAPGDWQLCDRT